MDILLKTYKKDFTHSYSVGVFPTLELITYRPQSVIKILLHSRAGRNSGVDKIRDFAVTNAIPVETNDLAINKLSHSENCYAVGVFNKYTTPLSPTDNHLVLVNPEDMGNLGTIIRTMLGFGVHNLALIRPAPDIFDPKVIRASMGAVFSVNITYFEDFSIYTDSFPRQYYPFMTDGKTSLNEIKFHSPFSLIFGNEGAGLEPQFLNAGDSIRIPQSSAIDSLNLSVAVAIGLYSANQ